VDSDFELQLLEDVNKSAFKSLNERMGLELSKALIRVALKKVAEYQVKQEDKTLALCWD
jgi:antitoxin component of RelBE/YafQ-DinJ toxin-antitoxin module